MTFPVELSQPKSEYLFINLLTCSLVLICLLTTKLAMAEPQSAYADDAKSCASCHQKEYQEWLSSDHNKAMTHATKDHVQGNFSNHQVVLNKEIVLFSSNESGYLVTINDKEQHKVLFTFGHYPLQQYLVDIGNGKLQALPYAWDSRSKEQGGQRWFHVYQDDVFYENDRLHWKQPLQNWNGMCADCHSKGLQRNYDQQANSFDSHWQEINVSCQSCHDVAPEHAALVGQQSSTPDRQWQLPDNQPIAQLTHSGESSVSMDSCFACHALRSPLTDGFSASDNFHDAFRPQLLTPPMYHVDGQIREEVYVYGSFMQSKMFRAGVTCMDCHNPHTGKVKYQDNQLCTQCHAPAQYDTQVHHKHPQGAGTMCVDCHMPETTYMQVDPRRDHSFVVPNLTLSRQFDTPLVCDTCHQDKGKAWVDANYPWDKQTNSLLASYANWMQFGSQALNSRQWLALVQNPQLDDMKRATALMQLGMTDLTVPAKQLAPFLQHENPLVRQGAIEAFARMQPAIKTKYLGPLLQDSLRSVRITAAQSLAGTPLSGDAKELFQTALTELLDANEQTAWRGEGRVNLAQIYSQSNQLNKAIEQLEMAIFIDPYYEVGYLNLADVYRAIYQETKVKKILEKGIKALSQAPYLHYSLGLHFIRARDYQQAVNALGKAFELAPYNQQFSYAYLMILDELGLSEKRQQAIEKLNQS